MNSLRSSIALVSLALVVGIALWESEELISPGPLHPSHARLPDLTGSAGCAACHGDESTGLAAACNQCHEEIDAQLDHHRGLHGALEALTAKDCGGCHREHVGGSLPLVAEHTFRAAGIEDGESYDHRHAADFLLAGRHADLACDACHLLASVDALEEGQLRYLGLSQVCQACHEDPHAGDLGLDCARCHGQEQPFDRAVEFEHDAAFPLAGGHAGLSCKSCHDAGARLALAAPGSGPVRRRQCAECHADPHRAAEALPVVHGGDCASCHTTDSFADATFGVAAHADIGVVLRGPHAQADCAGCHTAERVAAAATHRPGTAAMQLCRSCHRSPHRRELLAAVAEGGLVVGCTPCHLDEHDSFLAPDAAMPIALHSATGFPLDAPHDALDCSKCHPTYGKRAKLAAGPDLRDRFTALFPNRAPEDCARCHGDPHGGQFDRGATGGRCIECHERTHFQPSAFDIAQHARCAFPLTGSHAAVACDGCHTQDQGERVPRRFIPTPKACQSCHEDVHRGIFDGPSRPAVVAGRSGCARCHVTDRFAQIRMTAAEHGEWTGYPLKGEHARAGCKDCHVPTQRADAHGRTFGRAGRSCAACHTDPHAGQFRIGERNDCTRCHDEVGRFREPRFDHARDARLPLDENHRKLECAACHKPVEARNGVQVIRYRPLGIRCQDCHGVTPRGSRGMR